MKRWLLAGLTVFSLFVSADSFAAGRYSDDVYQNLQKTRDALLGQRTELERARTETMGQIDKLNQKLGRIDQYLKQVDESVRDVDSALHNF